MEDFTKCDESFSKPIVEFTEDEWNTIYEGHCVDKTTLCYLVRSTVYGTRWIPKRNVRKKVLPITKALKTKV